MNSKTFFQNAKIAASAEDLYNKVLNELMAYDPDVNVISKSTYQELADLAKYFFECAAKHPEKEGMIVSIAPLASRHVLFVTPTIDGMVQYLIGFNCG